MFFDALDRVSVVCESRGEQFYSFCPNFRLFESLDFIFGNRFCVTVWIVTRKRAVHRLAHLAHAMGIFPAVLLSFGSILFNLFKIKRRASLELNELTFRWSVSLLLVGFLFGSLIRGSDLRIPGHYHASIGAVTIALMAEALSLLGGAKAKSSRVVVWLYGVGQLIFSAGLFIGGTYGMGRKTYGMEQHISNHGQTVGFAVMAIGGVFAFSAGALFAVIAIRAWRRQVVTGEVPAVF